MVHTKSRQYDAIRDEIDKKSVISIISCNNCVRVCGTGGRDKLRDLALRLRKDGYRVKDGFLITKACPQPYMGAVSLDPMVDTVVVLACYAGWSNAKRRFPGRKIVSTTEDVGLLITDSDKGVVKLVKTFGKYGDLLGTEFEIGTGKPLSTNHIEVQA